MGMAMTVGEPIDQMAKHMAESADSLSVDEYTKEEAMAILEKRKQGKWEEADALRREILRRKTGQGLVADNINIESPRTNVVQKPQIPVQVPVKVVELGSPSLLRTTFQILLILSSLFAGYFMIKILNKRGTRQ